MSDYRYPIARCPSCGRAVIYSDDPRDRGSVTLRPAAPDYHGKSVLCAKCKTMLALIDLPRPARSGPAPHP